MRWLVIVTLLLGAHFALTAVAPGDKALLYWPFAKDSRPSLDFLGSAAKPVTLLLSAVAGICFLFAVLALFGWLVPSTWLPGLIIAGALASALLFVLYLGAGAWIPLAIDAFLLWGVLGWHWTAAMLRGG